jgi:hypothetical protein
VQHFKERLLEGIELPGLLSFPTGANDDLMDAFCQGVIWLQQQHWRSRGRSEPPRPLLFSH